MKPFLRELKCPECGGKVITKQWSLFETFIGGCFFEVLFWLVIGTVGIALVTTLGNDIGYVIAFILLILVLVYVGRINSTYICKACNKPYSYKELANDRKSTL